MIRFDGNEIDYYIGLDDGDNLFVLGEGTDTGQKRAITMDTNQQVAIPATTMVINPAAGPLTPNLEPLNKVTTIPPIIPAIRPENALTPEPWAIPIHKGSATNQTTTAAGMSFLK